MCARRGGGGARRGAAWRVCIAARRGVYSRGACAVRGAAQCVCTARRRVNGARAGGVTVYGECV
eukprot:7378568-Prymnesium_polylepis.1